MIGFDPNDTVRVMLNCVDGGKPEAERARFEIRHLTSRQVKQVEKLRQAGWDADGDEARIAKFKEAILIGIVGWEGVKDHEGNAVPFSVDTLEEFSPRDLSRMCAEYPSAVFLAEGEKKTSPSPSASTGSAHATALGTGSAAVARA